MLANDGRRYQQSTGAASMGSFPTSAKVVIIGAGIVGNSIAYHLANLGVEGHPPHRQGTAAQPGRLDRPRVELPVPGRPQQGDGGADARERAPVQGLGRLHGVRRSRGRAVRDPAERAAPQDGLVQELGHRLPPGDPRRDQGAGPVHRREHPRRRLLHAGRRRLRLAAVRDAVPREGGGDGCPVGVREHRGHARWASRTAASGASRPAAAPSRPSTSSSRAASGPRSWPRWPARGSRSPRSSTR